jgi:hypothetical protein
MVIFAINSNAPSMRTKQYRSTTEVSPLSFPAQFRYLCPAKKTAIYMKTYLFLSIVFLVTTCRAQSSKSPAANTQPPADIATLKWNLRDIIKMQLPLTYPEAKNGRDVKKSYSFDTGKDTPTVWEIPEKLHDAQTDTLFSGGKYYLPFEDIDAASIQLEESPDGTHVGVVIRAKKGKTFVYDPYYQGPDQQVAVVHLGWWDHIQDRTLGRLLTTMKDLASAMSAGK